MTEKTINISASLEARPSALLVQTASKFASNIYLQIGDKRVNAKSIMGIISLGIIDGQTITVKADGLDELKAAEELEQFLIRL